MPPRGETSGNRFILEGKEDFLESIIKLRKGRELRQVIRKTLRNAAKPILQTAKRFAPEDEGDLEESLKIRAGRKSRRGINIFLITGTRAELGIPSSSKGYYPAHIELGYVRGGRRVFGARVEGTDVPPIPFLREAMDVHRKGAIADVERDLGAGIERIAQK